jgi:hypothetical protein
MSKVEQKDREIRRLKSALAQAERMLESKKNPIKPSFVAAGAVEFVAVRFTFGKLFRKVK